MKNTIICSQPTTQLAKPSGRAPLNVLELFAGSRSIGNRATLLGMNVHSVDNVPYPGINYVVDILNFKYSMVPFWPDVIWASPPCTQFSICSVWKYWITDPTTGMKVPKNPHMLGIQLLNKTLDIIRHYQPDSWFIENPRGMMRNMGQMAALCTSGEAVRRTVTYCQYGASVMKPTDIWTNNRRWVPKPMCKPGAPCHASSPSGTNKGMAKLAPNAFQRSKIPDLLCKEILTSC